MSYANGIVKVGTNPNGSADYRLDLTKIKKGNHKPTRIAHYSKAMRKWRENSSLSRILVN